jgi:formylglycine-generating enzyme required for sulfatase activity
VQAVGWQAIGSKWTGDWAEGKLPPGKSDHPVNDVAWDEAMAYCRWLSDVTGRAYSLPSEAEWEKGARGTDGRIYPWGKQWDATRCNADKGDQDDTTPVDAYPQGASPYGVLDMAGNVWEWTRSL